MVLKNMHGFRRSALYVCLALSIAPLFNAYADEPELIANDSITTLSAQPLALSPGMAFLAANTVPDAVLRAHARSYRRRFQRASRRST